MKPSVLLLIALITAALACGCISSQGAWPGQGTGEIRQVVYALLPLTGDLSATGESAQIALNLAVRDMNAFDAAVGSPYRIEVVTYDTATDPEKTLVLVEELEKRGGHLIVGAFSSAQLQAIKSFTDSHGILVAATSSSAPGLALQNDSIFRYCPDDTYQARAMSYLMNADRIRGIVTIRRDDLWGRELHAAMNDSLMEYGISEGGSVIYSGNTREYSAVISELDHLVGEAIGKYGPGSVGVHAITFEEIGPIMETAAGTGNLTSVRWYGSDGNTLIPGLTGGGRAALCAASVRFTGVIMGIHRTGSSPRVYEEIRARLGREPDAHSLAMYDLLQVAGAIRKETASEDMSSLSQTFTAISEIYTGVSGECRLNSAGDRKIAVYDYWRIRGEERTRWDQVGRYTLWPDGPEFELNPMGFETPWETR